MPLLPSSRSPLTPLHLPRGIGRSCMNKQQPPPLPGHPLPLAPSLLSDGLLLCFSITAENIGNARLADERLANNIAYPCFVHHLLVRSSPGTQSMQIAHAHLEQKQKIIGMYHILQLNVDVVIVRSLAFTGRSCWSSTPHQGTSPAASPLSRPMASSPHQVLVLRTTGRSALFTASPPA